MTGAHPLPPVPKVLRWLSWAVLAAAVLMIFAGAARIGVTWDEPYHVQRFNTYTETGWYLSDGQLREGEPGPGMEQQYVYAPATMLLLHGLAVLTGVEPMGTALTTPEAYLVRHIGIGLLSLLGMVAVLLTGRLWFRRWDWAVLAVAVLAAVPMWTGYSMYNLKDIPVSAGYALATLGMVALGRSSGRWRHRLLGVTSLTGGLLLAVGTRPGMWTGLAIGLAALVVCRLLRTGEVGAAARVRRDLSLWRDGLLAVAVALLGLWLIDPQVFSNPASALWQSISASSGFIADTPTRAFVPVRVFLQMPLLILGFFGFGLVVGARALWRSRFRPDDDLTTFTLLVAQTFAMPAAAIVMAAGLYGDLRQLLFAVSSTALVATYGMAELLRRAQARAATDRLAAPLTASAIGLALVVPTAAQAVVFPYNYTVHNPLATISGVPQPGDFYRASGRELVPHIPAGRVVCSPKGDDHGLLRFAHLDAWVDCATFMSSPVSAHLEGRDRPDADLGDDEFWAVTFGAHDETPANCKLTENRTHRGLWYRLQLAALWRCERPFPVLTTGGASFDMDDKESWEAALPYPDVGWFLPQHDGSTPGIASRGGPSTLRFRLPETSIGRPAHVLLTTARATQLRATFGATPVRVRKQRGAETIIELTIPAELVRRAAHEAQTLSLSSTSSEPLDLSLVAISLRAEG